MSEDKEIEQEIIEQLLKSKGILGELNEVVYDSDGEILSGRHRIKAGWTLEKTVDTQAIAKKLNLPRKLVKEMFRLHFNVQRRPSKEETQRRLLLMAEELVQAGVAKPNVATELAKWAPYSHEYILRLLPDEYKQKEFVDLGQRSAEAAKARVLGSTEQKFETPEDLIKEIVRLRDEGKPYKYLYSNELANQIPVSVYYAVDHGLPIDEVIKRMEVQPRAASPQASQFVKKTYTDAETKLLAELNRRGISFITQQTIEREGEFTEDGKPKCYVIDILIDKNLAVEVEGEGSSSKDNDERDLFLREKGYQVIHVPNGRVLKNVGAVVDEIEQILRAKPVEEQAKELAKEALQRGRETKSYEDLLEENESLKGKLEEAEQTLKSMTGEYTDNCPFCRKSIFFIAGLDAEKKFRISITSFKRR